MASTSTQIVSYSSPPLPQDWTNDVFLSFRGEDTRYNFTDHLYTHLVGRGIRTFRDDPSLKSGEEIAPELLKAIEESRFSIVVFSKNYADSRWCLEELAKIMDCRKEMGQTIIPVFYHVDPSDVRNQRGTFGEALSKYEEDTEAKKVRRWRTALTEAANLSGHHVEEKKGYESKVIKEISENIRGTLNRDLLHVDENIVGMNWHFEKVISQLRMYSNDVRMVGIFGFGGIGKTTIAKVVYNTISHQYEGSSFLGNVRETSIGCRGLIELQEQLLDDILVGGKHKISSVDQGKKMIQTSLWSKRILIILDDVDDMGQLESLVGSKKWFGQGSRIVITTRDKHLLIVHGADESYHVKELNFEEAIELFSWNAFKQSHPKQEYRRLSKCMVHYAQGLPLALKILGSSLYGKTIPEWESELDKLKIIPNMDIQGILKISYDKLDYLQKKIFLDIACFFKGQDRDFVSRILDGCNFFATSGIRVLCDRCLISVSDFNTIQMHDLIQQMGWDIVRGNHYEDPSQWNRLWNPEDISRAFAMEKDIQNIEGIFVDMSKLDKILMNSKVWIKMQNLRILKIYWSNWRNKEHLPEDFEFSSHKLAYLHLEGVTLKSLPSNFCGENLVAINLERSNIRKLWEGNMCLLPKLKVLNLFRSEELIEISNFSSMPNLETLDLTGCWSLEKLDPSLGKLDKLVLLSFDNCTKLRSLPEVVVDMECLKWLKLGWCKNLRSLPSNICRLKVLPKLNLSGCPNLEAFPAIEEDMESLEQLKLSETGIKELPPSIEHLIHLTSLELRKCKNLRSLPSSIGRLKFLHRLDLKGCSNLEAFPAIEEDMESLKELEISETGIKELPPSIEHLIHLTSLELRKCKNLRSLPSSIGRLKFLHRLNLEGCSNLEAFPAIEEDMESLKELEISETGIKELPPSIKHLINLTDLNLTECKNLRSLPSSICRLKFLRELDLSGCSNLESFPAIEEDMEFLKELELSETGIKELPPSIEHLINLTDLNLRECKNLRSLPSSICRLKFLPKLDLSGCSNLEAFPAIEEDMESLKELELSETGIKELPPSIKHLINLTDLNLTECKNLRSLPSSICRLKFLRELDLCGCSNLESFPAIEEDMEFLKELELGETGIKELPPSIEHLIHLTSLELRECKNLRSLPSSICRLKFLPNLDLSGCSNLEAFPAIEEDMESLKQLELSETGIKELPPSIKHLINLTNLNLTECKNLRSLPSSICRLKFLRELDLSGCSNLESFPAIEEDMEFLKELELSETGIKELPPSIEHLINLTHLNLRECKNLRSLPSSICRLKFLRKLGLSGCSNLEAFLAIKEDMESLEVLELGETGIKELPPSIEHLIHLTSLELRECKNLRSLPSSICRLKFLRKLYLSGCSNLESFPAIEEDMEFLKELELSETGIKELPPSIEHLIHLTSLELRECKNLRSLPSSICRLKFLQHLNLKGCSNLEAFPAIEEDMESLKQLELSETGIKELPSSIQHLRRLKLLHLNDCANLATLTNSIYKLTCLEALAVKGCSKLEKFPRSPWNLKSSCRVLKLDLSHGNWLEGAIPIGVSQFCQVLSLNISYCKVERIPELPSNLRRIVAHECTSLETLSSPSSLLCTCLVKWFKSQTLDLYDATSVQHVECVEYWQWWPNFQQRYPCKEERPVLEMVIAGGGVSGIPGWVSHQQKGRQVKIELPVNWYQDNLFLGFAFFSLDCPRYRPGRLALTLHGNANKVFVYDEFYRYQSCEHPSELCEYPIRLWLVCYPKSNIPDKFHSNQFTHLEASFGWEWEDGGGCGVHLMYLQNHQQNNVQFQVVGAQDDDENMLLDQQQEEQWLREVAIVQSETKLKSHTGKE